MALRYLSDPADEKQALEIDSLFFLLFESMGLAGVGPQEVANFTPSLRFWHLDSKSAKAWDSQKRLHFTNSLPHDPTRSSSGPTINDNISKISRTR